MLSDGGGRGALDDIRVGMCFFVGSGVHLICELRERIWPRVWGKGIVSYC